MIDRLKAIWQEIILRFSQRTLGFLVLVILVAAIPLTVYVAQQQQEVRQRAQECDPNECIRYGDPECDENGENCGESPCLGRKECPSEEPTSEPNPEPTAEPTREPQPDECPFEFKYNECTGCEASRPVYQNCKGEYDTGSEKSDQSCKDECNDPSDPNCPFEYLRNECTGCETSQPIYQNCRGEFHRGPEKSDSACKNECAQDPNCPFVYKYNECTGCETSQPVYQNCKGEFDTGPERSDSACKNECKGGVGGNPPQPQPNCGFGLDNQCYCDSAIAPRNKCDPTAELKPGELCEFTEYCDPGDGNVGHGKHLCKGTTNADGSCSTSSSANCGTCNRLITGEVTTCENGCGNLPPSCDGNETKQAVNGRCTPVNPPVYGGDCKYDVITISGNPLSCRTSGLSPRPTLPPAPIPDSSAQVFCDGYLSCAKTSDGTTSCRVDVGHCGYNPEANCSYSQADKCFAGLCQDNSNCGFNQGCKYNALISRDAIPCPGTQPGVPHDKRNTPEFLNICRDVVKYKSYQTTCDINGDKLVNDSDLRRILENINKAPAQPPRTTVAPTKPPFNTPTPMKRDIPTPTKRPVNP